MGKNPFNLDVEKDPRKWGKPIGEEVYFLTSKPMDFEDWIGFGGEKGQLVRLIHGHIKSGVTKTETTTLQFLHVDHDPDLLVFQFAGLKFSLGIPEVNDTVLSGKLFAEGNNPGDFFETPGDIDVVEIQETSPYYQGLLVSFPTGKAGLGDLTREERKVLTDFVTNRSRAIAAFAGSGYKVTNPRP
jgi:hypothetical protein